MRIPFSNHVMAQAADVSDLQDRVGISWYKFTPQGSLDGLPNLLPSSPNLCYQKPSMVAHSILTKKNSPGQLK